MAFETLSGQRIFSNITGQTFIFGDYFAVFIPETASPSIYEWNQLISITEGNDGYSFYTFDAAFSLEKSAFSSNVEYLKVRAIIEGQLALYRNIKYKHKERILPLKYLYQDCSISSDAYFFRGVYSEKDINSCNIALVSTKIGKYIILFGILLAVIAFFLLGKFCGSFDVNWYYYLPISLFTSTIVCIIIYLLIAVVARHKYSKVMKVDPALSEEVTIVIAPEGFSALESFCYTGCDIIPWKEASFFIETHSGLVVIRDNKSVFWLPRNFVPKNLQPTMMSFIAARVKQK